MEDQTTEAVQPEPGQGDGGDSPYSQYLEQIPEEARDAATQAFKQWDGDVTRRFQDASEYKKTWEPYEQAGLNQYDPQALSQHLQMLQDPAAVVEWARGIAQQNGIDLAPQQEQAQEFQYTDAYQDPSQQQQFEQWLDQKLGPLQKQFEQFQQQDQQRQEAQNLERAEQFIQGQLDELEQKHGQDFNREMVERLAQKHTDDPYNAISKAWDEWQKIVGGIQKSTLQPKVDAPNPAETSGVANMTVDQPKNLQDSRISEMALQILRNNRAS